MRNFYDGNVCHFEFFFLGAVWIQNGDKLKLRPMHKKEVNHGADSKG